MTSDPKKPNEEMPEDSSDPKKGGDQEGGENFGNIEPDVTEGDSFGNIKPD